MPSETAPLRARGGRVRVATAGEQDVAPYRRAVEASRERLARWNPVDPDDLARQLPLQSRDRRTFLVHALIPEGEHDIVGKINVSDVVRGRFESAAVGYDAYQPYAGRGLFAEGLRLFLNLAFRQEAAGGMGLHRIAAAVQPGNMRSAGLLRSLGFQREGFSPGMLWLPGPAGEAWRDHDSYVMRREDWPSPPYPNAAGRTMVVLVNGPPGSGTMDLARGLAAELRIPVFCRDVIGQSGPEALWSLLRESPVGGVVEGWFRPDEARTVARGLGSCGQDPSTVPEVWCLPARAEASARPLGLGPTVAAESGHGGDGAEGAGLGRADVVRMALRVIAAAVQHPRHNKELFDR